MTRIAGATDLGQGELEDLLEARLDHAGQHRALDLTRLATTHARQLDHIITKNV